jgi:hypothetical protein
MNNKINKKYSKQSFDRFGDDLCQLLLTYLSISDKMRFECISKQWQRFIFNKQFKLIISVGEGNDTISKLLFSSKKFKHLFNLKKDSFEILLKKLKSINEIVIDNYCIIDGQILQYIYDNCLHLQRFVCTSIKIENFSERHLREFSAKCGQKLKFIQFDGINEIEMRTILRLSPNMRFVNIKNNNFIKQIDSLFIDSTTKQLLSPKLDSICISCYCVDDLMAFADKYSQQIKKIEIKFMSNYLIANVINNALKQISRFVNLETLYLLIYNHQKGYIYPIDLGLQMIAKKCTKLKHFICEMTKNLVSGQLFEVFSNFRSLETCKISTTDEHESDYGSIVCLKYCSNLTHLTLYLQYLSDKHLKDIDLYLPKLKSFKLNTSNGFITDQTFHCLAKLQKLSVIEISGITSSMFKITDAAVCNTIINCPNLKSVSLFCRTNVTQKAINTFVNRAHLYPKENYQFFYQRNEFFDTQTNSQTDTQSDAKLDSINPLPHNLFIYSI